MTFRTQVVSSAAWAGASNILIKMFSFVAITLVLARVLDVADFGLVAVALLAINSIDLFREFGIASALIYRQAEGEEDVSGDVAHISLIVGGVIVYAAIYLAAPWVEAFFKDAAGVTPVLRALGLIVLINSFSQTPYTLLAKRLHFRAKAIPEIIGGLLNSIIAILLALRGFGVWALVAGYLTDAATRTLLVWFFSSWRPRWRFDRRVWREMAAYGRHIVGSRLLIFGITNIDDLLVGRMLGTASLGYYGLAYRLSNVPATHVTSLINSVMFPAFSLIQKEQERVRRVYFDTMHAVGLVSIPLAVGTLLLGPFFVHQYYLGKWDGAIVAMQWLTIYGLMRSIAANLGNIYRALGKPQWLTYLALWRFLTMLALLVPAIRWRGIVGVSVLSAGVAVIDFGISAWLGNKLLGGGYGEYLRRLGPILLISLLSGGAAALLLPILPVPHRLFPLLAAGVVMILLYLLLSWRRDLLLRQMILAGLRRVGPARGLARRLEGRP